MRTLKLTLLLAALVIAGNVGIAQNTGKATIPPKTQTDSTITDSTISREKYSEPTVYVGDIYLSGKQSKDAILETPFLSAKSADGVEWNIVSYQATFVVNGTEDAPISVTGANFSEEVIAKIQSAKSGTIIEFSDIKVSSSTAGTRTIVRPIVVRIQ